MYFLVFIAIIFIISYIFEFIKSKNNSSHSTPPYNSQTPSYTKKDKNSYRPNKNPSRTINFENSTQQNHRSEITQDDLKDLHDAFTGAPLDKKFGLYRCNNCQVYYHTTSYSILVSENNGMCMACGSTNLISATNIKSDARNAQLNSITLDNYKQYLGRVITFESYVYSVEESKRGNDFAVMFENKSWTRGFKLVFFRGSISQCGGGTYIKNLCGKTIKVRGLLKYHPKFGYEIVISEKNQILKVS